MRLSQLLSVASLSLALVSLGCGAGSGVTTETRSTYVTEHPDTPAEFVPSIMDGKIMVGMSQAMVIAAWGPATRDEIVHNDARYDRKWVYGNYLASSAVSHLYFKDGRVEMFEFIDTKTQQSFQVTNPGERLALQSRPPETKSPGLGSP